MEHQKDGWKVETFYPSFLIEKFQPRMEYGAKWIWASVSADYFFGFGVFPVMTDWSISFSMMVFLIYTS